jgi:hypothetical protein
MLPMPAVLIVRWIERHVKNALGPDVRAQFPAAMMQAARTSALGVWALFF